MIKMAKSKKFNLLSKFWECECIIKTPTTWKGLRKLDAGGFEKLEISTNLGAIFYIAKHQLGFVLYYPGLEVFISIGSHPLDSSFKYRNSKIEDPQFYNTIPTLDDFLSFNVLFIDSTI